MDTGIREGAVQPGIPTFPLGPKQVPHYVEWSRYAITGQPCLKLCRYAALDQKVILTIEAPMIDLRDYDADFAFKRRHALIRYYGPYVRVVRELVRLDYFRPIDRQIRDGHIEVRPFIVDRAMCVPDPTDAIEDV